MVRLYFWFLGIPEDRLTGPWWMHDFPSRIAVELFLADALPFLKAYSIVPEAALDHEELYIKPPEGATIIYQNKETVC